MNKSAFLRLAGGATLTVAAQLMIAGSASAGGFDIKEQSTHYQGMSFAGSAAGGTLSSMFWNPAAASAAVVGLNMESSYALILPDSEITGSVSSPVPAIEGYLNSKDDTVDVGEEVVVPASYMAWRGEYDPRVVFALSINSQYGLGTKPDNLDWVGQEHSRSAKIFSVNVAPTISYDVMPGVTVGGGLQVEYFDLRKLKTSLDPAFATTLGLGADSNLEGDDIGVGFTAGILLKPAKGTSIGVGYRSTIEHELRGNLAVSLPGLPTSYTPIKANLDTPDKVTASFEQAITPALRALGTVEWTNWSKLGVIPVNTAAGGVTVANIDLQWQDGWFFSLGGEYDYSSTLTLRAGVAYEISPIGSASERLLQLPDNDRIWASIGGTYKWSENISFDFAYSHLFVEDGDISRYPATTSAPLSQTLFTGEAESSIDIISVGVKTVW